MFILGALSKLVATGSTYPYIVVKSRLQAATHQYKSSVSAVLHILKKEGVKGESGAFRDESVGKSEVDGDRAVCWVVAKVDSVNVDCCFLVCDSAKDLQGCQAGLSHFQGPGDEADAQAMAAAQRRKLAVR